MSPIFKLFGFALLAVGAGVSFVMQQAVNADLRSALGSAAWAGFVSYLGGTLCMLVLAAALRDGVPSAAAVLRSNWWAWSGGFFGAIYIAISILLVPRLGTTTFVALTHRGPDGRVVDFRQLRMVRSRRTPSGPAADIRSTVTHWRSNPHPTLGAAALDAKAALLKNTRTLTGCELTWQGTN